MTTTTSNHDTLKSWIDQRGGVPSSVEETAADGQDAGILRVDFPDSQGDDGNLSTISWSEFFEEFDEAKLACLHDDETTDSETSRFCKFVSC